MNDLLHNPVFNALRTGDQRLGFGSDKVKCFDEDVSPFAGFESNYANGFAELYDMLPAGRKILYAHPEPVTQPKGWQIQDTIKGLQFVYAGKDITGTIYPDIVPLAEDNVAEMIALVNLTRPGPFGKRTIEFGSYHGIFSNGKLAAMTGQRMHVHNYTELSAVCTHPDHSGKGYASALMQHQLQIILQQGQQPFLHVRQDNQRAIDLYERLGFRVSRPMNFSFMIRQ